MALWQLPWEVYGTFRHRHVIPGLPHVLSIGRIIMAVSLTQMGVLASLAVLGHFGGPLLVRQDPQSPPLIQDPEVMDCSLCQVCGAET